jgi:hypothetical protein
MSKQRAQKIVTWIEDILSDGDCGRFFSLAQCKRMAATARRLCRKFDLAVPWRVRL